MTTADDRHQLAQLRAEALLLALSAVAAGIWEPTPDLLDPLPGLAAAIVFDLGVADLDAAA